MLSGERTGEKRDGLTDVLAGGPTLQVPHDPARRRQPLMPPRPTRIANGLSHR